MKNNQATYNYLNIIPFQAVTNWSASAILRNKLLYKPGMKLEKIGNLIRKSREKTNIKDDVLYKRVTVRLYNNGVIQRDEVFGKTIGTKNQNYVRTGQFIMSKIDARNGAFGIVPLELDGAAVTHDFLAYDINSEKVLPEFFILLTYSDDFRNLCQQASSGTTGRQRIDEKAFLNFEVPIPDLIEQEKMVIAYKGKMELAEHWEFEATQIEKSFEDFIYSTLWLKRNTEIYSKKKIYLINSSGIIYWGADKILGSESYASTKFETIDLETRPICYIEAFRGKSPKYDILGTKSILNQKCNRWNKLDFKFTKPVNEKWYNRIEDKFFTKKGDVIINSTGEGTIGRATYIKPEYEGWMYDSHMLLLRLNPKKINPEYFTYLLNSSYGQNQIEALKSAKSTKQTELGIQNLLKIFIPIPSLDFQLDLVDELKKMNEKMHFLRAQAYQYKKQAIENFGKSIFKTKE